MSFNPKRYWAIKNQAEKCLANVPDKSGIYIWKRQDNNITYWYVGQAKSLRKRFVDYYLIKSGVAFDKRHFALSLKAHKDWKVSILELCDVDKLNEREQYWINEYLGKPYHQTRNSTLGGQNGTKVLGERTKTTATKQKKAFREEFYKGMSKHLGHLDIEQNEGFLCFKTKKNKNGSENQLSIRALEYLKKVLLE